MIEANWDITILVGLMTLVVATVQLYISWRQMPPQRGRRHPPPRVEIVTLTIKEASEKEVVVIIRVYYRIIRRALMLILAKSHKLLCSAIRIERKVKQLKLISAL
jgi:hypothetical protein